MSDCLIIGGGVIGMMSARALAAMGANVTVLDSQECGKESSWAGGGIISPIYPWLYSDLVNELSLTSQTVYAKLCEDLLESTGIDPEYIRCGLIMMDNYDTPKAQHWIKKHKINIESHTQGMLFTDIAQVRNPRLLKALKIDILNAGVKIVEHSEVKELMIKNNTVFGAKTLHKNYYSDKTILCNGAWGASLLNNTEIFPIKGQMIVIKAKADTISHIIVDQGRYLIPRKDGNILIGSTMENVGFDRRIEQQVGAELLAFATKRFPQLNNAKIQHHWAGFRPVSRTGVIIKKHCELAHLFINIGHFRNGLNMAPESANRIVKLINYDN